MGLTDTIVLKTKELSCDDIGIDEVRSNCRELEGAAVLGRESERDTVKADMRELDAVAILVAVVGIN